MNRIDLVKQVHANTTHGMRSTDFYNIWASIRQRCNNPKNLAYKNYGGRDIKCSWNTFEKFKKDMFDSYKKGLTIDRINNDDNYSKENCRWTTRAEQSRNTRRNVLFTFKGKEKCLSEWAEEYGIEMRTLWARINVLRWPIDKALTKMVQ